MPRVPKSPTVSRTRLRRTLHAGILVAAATYLFPPHDSQAHAPEPTTSQAAAPDTAVAEISQAPRIGLWSCWLTNGVRVHAKSLPGAADPAFAIAITITGGELLEPPGKRGLASAATGGWSLPKEPDAAQSEIVKQFLESQVRFFATAHTDAIQLWITGPESDLATGLALGKLLLERPGLDAHAFTARVQMLRDVALRPNADRAALDALRPFTLPASMPSARPVLASDMPALDPGGGLEWLTAALMQGSIEVGIASRVPAPDALDMAASAFASLPGRARIGPSTLANLRAAACPPAPDAPIIVHEGPARALEGGVDAGTAREGRALIALIGPPLDALTERRALAMGAFVLDDRLEAAAANDRAGRAKREVRVFPMNPGVRTARAVVAAMIASHDAESTAADLGLISAQLDALATVGPLAPELEIARSRVADILAQQDLSADAWASRLATLTYDGLSPAALAGALDEYRALTVADVRRAYAQWWTPATTVQIIVAPKPVE